MSRVGKKYERLAKDVANQKKGKPFNIEGFDLVLTSVIVIIIRSIFRSVIQDGP